MSTACPQSSTIGARTSGARLMKRVNRESDVLRHKRRVKELYCIFDSKCKMVREHYCFFGA